MQIINNILHKCLENAVKTELIARNPIVAVECPRIQHKEMTTLNEAEIHLLLDSAKANPYYALFFTLLFSGMRRSEALALKWQDVDLLLLKVSINKSLVYLSKPQADGNRILLKTPKTAKSRRNISLTPSNALVLREYYQKQNEERQSLAQPLLADDDFVFCDIKGNPYLPNNITHNWIKLVRKCGLKCRLHDIRHTHASLLLKQGVHPKIVQERLGHQSIAITLDLYSHVAPGMQEAAALKFDDIIRTQTHTSEQLRTVISAV